MQFEIKFDPDIDSVLKAVEAALKTTKSIPISTWSLVEDRILKTQVEHWEDLKEIDIELSTVARKEYAVRKGRKVTVGKGGRKEIPKYIYEGAHFTGFLRDRMTSKDSMRGYNTTHTEDFGDTKRGAYYFGVNPDYFHRDYPGGLADFILSNPGKPSVVVDEFTALIGIDAEKSESLVLYLWDLMWINLEKELKGIG